MIDHHVTGPVLPRRRIDSNKRGPNNKQEIQLNLITRVKQLTETAVSSSKARVDDVQTSRRRKALLAELGELSYRKHCGDPIDETAIDPVLAELDRIASRAA